MNRIPKPQDIYKHFKGNLYQVITLAEHSETGEPMVIYQALYGEFKVYARPLAMFVDKVDKAKYPAVNQEYRFELQRKADEMYDMEQGLEAMSVKDTVISTEDNNMSRVEKNDIPQDEPDLDPLVWEFLDADSHEKRLNILAALHHRITDDMITTMAVACDIEVPEGDLEERYSQLKNCLLMLDRFEIRRK